MKRFMTLLCFVSLAVMAAAQNFDDYNTQGQGGDVLMRGFAEDRFDEQTQERRAKSVLVDETYPSGDRYVGYKRGNVCHGHGTYYWADGSRYEGNFNQDQLEGYGILYNPDDTKAYEGYFHKDNPHGEGTLYFTNGRKYVGEWKNGAESGRGVLYDADERIIYEGDWSNGKPNGKGTYYWADGRKYVGDFRNGLSHGKGILYDANGSVIYSGEWKDDKPVE